MRDGREKDDMIQADGWRVGTPAIAAAARDSQVVRRRRGWIYILRYMLVAEQPCKAIPIYFALNMNDLAPPQANGFCRLLVDDTVFVAAADTIHLLAAPNLAPWS